MMGRRMETTTVLLNKKLAAPLRARLHNTDIVSLTQVILSTEGQGLFCFVALNFHFLLSNQEAEQINLSQ